MTYDDNEWRTIYEVTNGETYWILITYHFTGMKHVDERIWRRLVLPESEISSTSAKILLLENSCPLVEDMEKNVDYMDLNPDTNS